MRFSKSDTFLLPGKPKPYLDFLSAYLEDNPGEFCDLSAINEFKWERSRIWASRRVSGKYEERASGITAFTVTAQLEQSIDWLILTIGTQRDWPDKTIEELRGHLADYAKELTSKVVSGEHNV